MFEALSKKRIEYEYENEYRVFIVPSIFELEEAQYLEIGNFKQTLMRIVLSPHIDVSEYQSIRLDLITKYKIDKKIIEKSKLYSLEDFKKEHGL